MNRGDYLRHLRQNVGLTQQEVAEKLGVHFSSIYKYEKNTAKLSADKLERLAEIYGVTPGEILSAGVKKLDYFKTLKLTIAKTKKATGISDYAQLPDDLKNILANAALEALKAFYNDLEE